MDDRLMSFKAAGEAAGGLSESSVRRLIEQGRFPRPIAISLRRNGAAARVAFVEREVREAVAKMISEARESRGVSPSELLNRDDAA